MKTLSQLAEFNRIRDNFKQNHDYMFMSRDGEVWYRWSGGESNIPRGDCIVALRSEEPIAWVLPSSQWIWDHHDEGGDIIAYTIVED